MTRADVISAGVLAIQAAEASALGSALGAAYDQGGVDQKASDGTFTQADIDSAVAAAQAVDAAAQAAAVKVVQDALTALIVKESAEASELVALQSGISALVALFPVPAAPVSA